MHKYNYKNIYTNKDRTFTSLQKLRKNKNIIILSADKESCTVILNKSDYVQKVDQMIEDGITEGNYIEISDNILCDLKRFQNFLYRHLYKHKDYEAMRPRSNQPGRFFASAKTQKFKSIEYISLESLKLRPIIDQRGTYVSNASKFVAKYLPTRQQDVVARCHDVSMYIPASSHVRPNDVLMERRQDVSVVCLLSMSRRHLKSK